MRVLATALMSALLPISAAAETLKIYNWVDYFGETTVEDFERETGITVELSTFDVNEELEQALVDGEQYDLVFPSDSYFTSQVAGGMYQKINKMLIPNYYKGMDRSVLATLYETVDPGNRFGIPYLWGTTGLVVNAEQVRKVLGPDVKLDSWSLVYNKRNLIKLADACGVVMFDSPSEVIPSYLHYNKRPYSSADQADYRKAAAFFKSVQSKVTWLNSEPELEVLEGRACVATSWSGDYFEGVWALEEEGKPIIGEYVIPSEGAPMWFDMMAIPASLYQTLWPA